ncbi:MAG: AMP-binding protein [Gammaproteobacteria bacterium]|jgi:O-succinylbenzoic acid--CoA ligase|nr:AMP-binding protein [Gammaproteobacteria bacterium]
MPPPAVAVGAAHWSQADFAATAERLAGELTARGVQAEDLVLRPADDPMGVLCLLHALVCVGAGLLPYPAGLPSAQVDALAAAVGAEWRWGQHAPASTGRGAAADCRGATAPSLLIRTSGSGGTPKVVMLTAAQLAASATRVNAALDLQPGDEWLCVLPLHHIGGLAIGWRCALAGATLRLVAAAAAPAGSGAPAAPVAGRASPVAQRGMESADAPAKAGFAAEAVAATLARYPVTHLSLVPAMLARLLDVMPAPPPALRVLLLGGQALHPALARRAVAAGWPLFVSYGMTETGSMVAVGRWRDDDAPGNLVGPLLPDVQADCAGPGEPPRRLRLRGPMLMAGYADARRRPGLGLGDGWLTTSDLCRLEADGWLRVFGRADDLLVIGGEQVSPAAVEAKLAAAPGVSEVAVVAVTHPHWGATLAACWCGPAAAPALEAWCRAELPSRERPRLFRRLERLPLLASGKPDRAALLRLIGAAGVDSNGAD